MLQWLRNRCSYFFRQKDPILRARELGVKIGKDCRLIDVIFSSEPYLITLGDHVSATATRFETHDGGVWVFRTKDPDIDVVRPIKVGNNVFIGYGCIILPGVTIGDNVVIGAGAVVTKDIPSDCVAVGVPARVIESIADYECKVSMLRSPTKMLSPEEKREFYLRKFNGSNMKE